MNKNLEIILRTENLFKTYKSSYGVECHAVNNVNLEIYRGEILLILGPSGAGKSTLLHLLGSLDKPSKGEIYFCEKKMPYNDEEKISKIRNEKFGFVFQFHHLLPEFTVLENLFIPMKISNKTNSLNLEEYCLKLLEKIGLKNKAYNFPKELSGGEQQRVSVLRALVNEPDIIFADEPTGNLDNKNRELTYNILEEIISGSGKTLVLVTHDTNIPFKNFRKITLIDGKIN
jgi:lipoprotein-releasing system ATP-binding protein